MVSKHIILCNIISELSRIAPQSAPLVHPTGFNQFADYVNYSRGKHSRTSPKKTMPEKVFVAAK